MTGAAAYPVDPIDPSIDPVDPAASAWLLKGASLPLRLLRAALPMRLVRWTRGAPICTADAPACTATAPACTAAGGLGFPGVPIHDRTAGCRLPANDEAASLLPEATGALGEEEAEAREGAEALTEAEAIPASLLPPDGEAA